MSTNEIKEFLLWNVGINYGVMLVWFGVFVYAHDWMYRMHTRWFKLSLETLDALHYGGLSIYKIGVILLNLAPLSRTLPCDIAVRRHPMTQGVSSHTMRFKVEA